MRQRARVTLLLAVCAVMGIGFGTAQASQDHKVQVCHGTASATNPYVLITVDEHALKGHFDENGTAPGHGWRNHPDVLITDEMTECPGSGGEGGGEG